MPGKFVQITMTTLSSNSIQVCALDEHGRVWSRRWTHEFTEKPWAEIPDDRPGPPSRAPEEPPGPAAPNPAPTLERLP